MSLFQVLKETTTKQKLTSFPFHLGNLRCQTDDTTLKIKKLLSKTQPIWLSVARFFEQFFQFTAKFSPSSLLTHCQIISSIFGGCTPAFSYFNPFLLTSFQTFSNPQSNSKKKLSELEDSFFPNCFIRRHHLRIDRKFKKKWPKSSKFLPFCPKTIWFCQNSAKFQPNCQPNFLTAKLLSKLPEFCQI